MKKMTFRRNRLLVATAATAVLATWVAPIPTANAALPTAPVYNSIPDPLPGNLPSLGFQANQTAEFGDDVQLAGTNRVLRSGTVTMSAWAKNSDFLPLSAGWQHPITLTIYNVDHTGAEPALGSKIKSVTQTFDIPWRPESDPLCAGGGWTSDGGTTCYNGKAFNVEFDLTSIGTVPNEIIYGIAYDTQTYGANPTGTSGPYNSLNVGLTTTGPTVGTDAEPDAVFWNTMTPSNYSDGGAGGIGTFRRDSGWSPYSPAVKFAAAAGNECSFVSAGTTMTLQSDCETDQTIHVPNGFTLNGNGHSITAVDPTSGHFVGAVVANSGTSANVTNLTVTVSNLADICDAGVDRLRGIMLDNASGSITNNTVTGVKQGISGCQEGNAIEVRNAPFTTAGPDVSVTISNNVVSDYQKTGIVANGSVKATITGNTVTGAGPVNYIAQNGIQIGFGATAIVNGNTASANNYTPSSDVACGILLFDADGVKMSKNTLFGNERDVCNFGKGGGKVKPTA